MIFVEGGKTVNRRKTLRARTRTNNKLNPHMTLGPGIEPGPHWWEASALTTVPTLLQIIKCTSITFLVHSQYSWELRCSPKKKHITPFGRLFSVDTQPHPHPMKFKFSFILSYQINDVTAFTGSAVTLKSKIYKRWFRLLNFIPCIIY